jgi:hypothetical protein
MNCSLARHRAMTSFASSGASATPTSPPPRRTSSARARWHASSSAIPEITEDTDALTWTHGGSSPHAMSVRRRRLPVPANHDTVIIDATAGRDTR